ncbi:hypothetical protein ILYODFUR_024495 [Ilyodon furcidens]|uniref:Uncharacterized protein n=1 Tax=Ilyodon furcidens TaxID=33524 RepID=A0ABV0TXX4_9TELE
MYIFTDSVPHSVEPKEVLKDFLTCGALTTLKYSLHFKSLVNEFLHCHRPLLKITRVSFSGKLKDFSSNQHHVSFSHSLLPDMNERAQTKTWYFLFTTDFLYCT